MLKGTLDDFALPDIFRLVMVAKRTGKLDIVRSAGSGKVFFREGEVYYAESTVAREPLGQKLIRSGALTEGGLLKALDENASTGERVGEILVRNGAVNPEQLQAAVREQIEDSVFDLLRWDLGDFNWEGGVIADVEVPISISVENLIMESSRRLDELHVILRKIPSENAVPAMASAPPEGAVEINITPQEWRMLVLVDGHRTIHDIAQQVGMDDFAVMRGIYGLLSAGLVEIADPGVVPDTSDHVVEEVHPAHQAGGSDGSEAAARQPAADEQPEVEGSTEAEEFSEAEEFAPEVEELVAAAEAPEEMPGFTEAPDQIDVSDLVFEEVPSAQVVEAPAAPEPVLEEVGEPDSSELAAVDLEAAIAQAQAESPGSEEASIYQDSFVADALSSFDEGASPAFEPLQDGKISFESFIDAPAEAGVGSGSEGNVFFMSTPDESGAEEDATGTEEPERRFEVLSGSDASSDEGDLELADDPLGMGSWEPSVVGFDAPEADEMTMTTPGEDPFLEDLFAGQPEEPRQAPPAPAPMPEAPAPSPAPAAEESPSVDRASVVRELAGLFSDDDRPRPRQVPSKPAAEGEEEDTRKRVEDDDQVTKGLISRLIDGVKGL